MLLKIKNIISLTLILIFASSYAFAQKPSDLIKDVVAEASRILSSSDPVEAKIINLNDLAENNVDIDRIAKYTLGKHRKTISNKELNKYFKLYKKYFLKNFSSRLIDYTNPEIIIVDENVINESFTIVNTILEATSKNPELKISWRVITKNPTKPQTFPLFPSIKYTVVGRYQALWNLRGRSLVIAYKTQSIRPNNPQTVPQKPSL